MTKIDLKKEVFTIPNILSAFRIVLIPFFVIFYFSESIKYHYCYAVGILVLSGFSDILDGTIARHFNMISSFGKIIDPLADKLTQGAAVICISINHPMLIPLLVLFCAKELTMLLGAVHLLKIGLRPSESKWWGKLCTVIVFILIVFVLITDIFTQIPLPVSSTVIIVLEIATGISLLFSLFNYYPVFKEIQNGEYDIQAECKKSELEDNKKTDE